MMRRMETRRVGVEDWQLVRAVRLRALADAPNAFGSSYDREAAFSDDAWIDRVGETANATFVCEHDGDACGIVTLVREGDNGLLVGMWVAPECRGDGAGDSLIAALLAWTEAHAISSVRLSVVETNERAQRLYARHGFRRVGPTFVNPQDGQIDIE